MKATTYGKNICNRDHTIPVMEITHCRLGYAASNQKKWAPSPAELLVWVI